METRRFDRLAKVLAARRPRRAALPILAALGMRLTNPEAGAAKKQGAKKVQVCNCASADVATCASQKKPQDKVKKLLRNNPCAYKGRCTGVSGCAAATPPPADVCQGRDVCTQGSAAACGPPGNECYCWVTDAGGSVCGGNDSAVAANTCSECVTMGRVCVRGGGINCPGPVICVLPCCPPGFRDCGGRCVDVLRDPDHCGACGRRCGPDRPDVCAGGSCCIDAGGGSPCTCSPRGGACSPVGNACCTGGASCTNGVCP